jgi:chromosome segregation ATPase
MVRNRTALAAAIAALAEEEARLQGLETARERSDSELAHRHHQLMEASAALRDARRSEPAALAYAWANNETLEDGQPTAEAEALVTRRRADHDHQTEISNALTAEISQIQQRVARAHDHLNSVLAEVVCNSDEMRALMAQLDEAWARIRGIRKAMDFITSDLKGNMPSALLSHWQASVPTDHRIVGYDTDESPFQAWSKTLEALRRDASVSLPSHCRKALPSA